jgi:TetR/AcrR family transcriptional regulator
LASIVRKKDADKVPKEYAEIEMVRFRRRQGRATITRQKILDAAAAEFGLAGFDGTTTRSIAARAKVAHGLVIHHFKTKEGVWQSVTEDVLHLLHSKLTKAMEELRGRDAATRLREAQRIFIRIAAKRPEVSWVLTRDVGRGAVRLQSLVEKIMGPDIDLAIDLTREAQSLGRYVKGDPAHLNYLFFGAASRIFMLSEEIKRSMGHSPFDEAFLEKHIELCQSLFFRDSPHAKPVRRVQSHKKRSAQRRRP